MARGSRKTPPPHTRSPIVTRSHSDNNVTSQTTTTSNENPQITIEPVTPNPQGSDVQEIVRQSLLRTHSALAHIRQPGQATESTSRFL
jgi:type II secretory pathway component PulM